MIRDLPCAWCLLAATAPEEVFCRGCVNNAKEYMALWRR